MINSIEYSRKEQSLFGIEAYSNIDNEKIFISKTYNLYCSKANKEYNQLFKKYEKNFRVDAVQRQYAKGFEIVSYLNEGNK